MVKASSVFRTSRSFFWRPSMDSWSVPPSLDSSFRSRSRSSCVVPLLPVVREAWGGRVALEEDVDDAADEVMGVAVAEEVGDALEGHDPADGLDNDPEVSERLRAFHAV